MPNHALVPDPSRLHLLSLAVDRDLITLTVRTCDGTARCPVCGGLSSRVHSRYRRTLADLPWQGIPARLTLWARRFFCDTPGCPRHIFTERLPSVAAPTRVAQTACATGCCMSPSRWAASRRHDCCDTSASRSAATPCSHTSVPIRPGALLQILLKEHEGCACSLAVSLKQPLQTGGR